MPRTKVDEEDHDDKSHAYFMATPRKHIMGENDLAASAHARMDRIEHNLETLTGEIPKLVNSMQKISEKVDARFSESIERADAKFATLLTNQSTIAANSRPELSKVLTGAGVVVAAVLTILGAFGSLAKSGVDSDISRLERSTEKGFDSFVPRKEVEYRFDQHLALLQTKEDKFVTEERDKRYAATLAAFSSDIDRLKSIIVSREENKSHWEDMDARIATLTTRVSELQKDSSGGSAAEQLRAVENRFDDFQRRFVAVPSAK